MSNTDSTLPPTNTPIDTLDLCKSCNCMTHTVDGKCGKCGADAPIDTDDIDNELRFNVLVPFYHLMHVKNQTEEDSLIKADASPIYTDAIKKIEALIANQVKQAQKDELYTAYTQVVGDSSVSLRSKFVKRFTKYLSDRIAELEKGDV